MIITLSDYNLKSLTRRVEEKLAQGYECVTKIKKVDNAGVGYSKGYAGQWEKNEVSHMSKWKIAMRKQNN